MRRGTIAILLLLAIWQVVTTAFRIPAYVIPKPRDVADVFVADGAYIAGQSMITFVEAGVALAFAVVTAWILAILMLQSRIVAAFLRPIISGMQSTPILAIAPILSAWFGAGITSKIVASALVVLPPITVSIADGLMRIPARELDLFRTMQATRGQVTLLLRVPRALPAFVTSLQVAIPLAILGAIVGEFVGASRGIGFAIVSASYYLRTSLMFAFVFVAAAGSGVAVWLVRTLQRRLLWRE